MSQVTKRGSNDFCRFIFVGIMLDWIKDDMRGRTGTDRGASGDSDQGYDQRCIDTLQHFVNGEKIEHDILGRKREENEDTIWNRESG